MRRLVIVGAGTAGTVMANRLRRRLAVTDWDIVVVDQEPMHHYQPGYLFIPFGKYRREDVVKPKRRFMPDGVRLILAEVDRIDPEASKIVLGDGSRIAFDYLIVATGTSPRPDQTPGMLGSAWREAVHEFYTLDGAVALARHLADWPGGRLAVHVTEMPIKCPVAPLEFAFLADAYFRERGIRDRVDIRYVTPLDGAFTKPVASQLLGGLLEQRGIGIEPDFYVESIDDRERSLVSFDERAIEFDLLVTVPLNMGSELLARSGMGDELNYLPVDAGTLLSREWDHIFAIGDAADLPTSKAGSTAHFAAEVLTENFFQQVMGDEMTHRFDGHANCFVETGAGQALLIDFNYETEPLPGKYPVPGIGPLTLLEETSINHLGKLAFKPIYWQTLRGRRLPVPSRMSMAGKRTPDLTMTGKETT